MKHFQTIQFNLKQYEQELQLFQTLLANQIELYERKDIVPFFKNHLQVANQIATLYIKNQLIDQYAFEFDVFGDFKCDLVLGNQQAQQFVFIEFEDASSNSIFKEVKGKYQSEYSSRFEHGYSQIIDWFYTLNDYQRTHTFQQKFNGSDQITYHGLLIIGREQFLESTQKKRLKWRIKHTFVNSKIIDCLTYDELYFALNNRFQFLKDLAIS